MTSSHSIPGRQAAESSNEPSDQLVPVETYHLLRRTELGIAGRYLLGPTNERFPIERVLKDIDAALEHIGKLHPKGKAIKRAELSQVVKEICEELSKRREASGDYREAAQSGQDMA